jgi:hypothetical protein
MAVEDCTVMQEKGYSNHLECSICKLVRLTAGEELTAGMAKAQLGTISARTTSLRSRIRIHMLREENQSNYATEEIGGSQS